MEKLIEEALTRAIIGAFYAVYNALGFGLPERVYLLALQDELKANGLKATAILHPPQRNNYSITCASPNTWWGCSSIVVRSRPLRE